MIISKFNPSPALQPYIHQYYLMEGDFGKDTQDVFFADGCVEIVFNIGVDFYKNNEKEDWAKFIGQITKPLEVTATGTGKSFGVWFKPHGFSMFSNIPLTELTDRTIPLNQVLSKEFINFAGENLQSNHTDILVNSLDGHFEKLLSSVTSSRKTNIAQFATSRLASSNTEMDLKSLTRDCDVSLRYLQQIFQETIGLSPKQFQKVSRFQKTLNQISADNAYSLTATGYDVGYYDQSHFIREFKSFTGFRPSDYRVKNHPINQHFLGI